jgi:polysaccharide biosynthesis protein PslH
MSDTRPRILFLAHLLPWPLEGGGQIKSYHTLRILASRFNIKMIAFIRSEQEKENIRHLQALCAGGIETVLLSRGKVRDIMQALDALVHRKSFLVSRDDSDSFRHCVQEYLTVPDAFQVVHVDHLQMMQFVPPADAIPPVKVVLDNHNIEHRIPKRLPTGTRNNPVMRLYAGQEWPKLRDFERNAVRRADLTLAVSEEDVAGLRELAASQADRIIPIPIGVDTDYFAVAPRKPASRTLLSIGTMYWPPNVEAMLYFWSQIWPKVKAKAPNVVLKIAGAKPTAAIRALPKKDAAVHVIGSVPDVRPYAEDCAAFIVPLLSGSGMRVKILNALSMGLPVVSTTVGAEGISVTNGENILLADTPEEFTDAVVRLLRDPDLGKGLGQAGRQLMEAQYSWDIIGRQLLQAYEAHVIPSFVGERTEMR